jgi:hypothetical protein
MYLLLAEPILFLIQLMKAIHLLFVFVRFLIDDSKDPIVKVARFIG